MKPFLFFYIILSFAGSNSARKIAGIYNNEIIGYGGTNLELKNDGSFLLKSATCASTYCSDGKWYLRGDTVVLNSRFKTDTLPFETTELRSKQAGSMVTITYGWPQQFLNTLALFYKDTTIIKSYLNSGDKVIPVNRGLKSFLISFENFQTRPYYIQDSLANNIVVNIATLGIYKNYRFIKNEKLLSRQGYLYPLNNSDRFGSVREESTDQRVAYRLKKR